MSPIVPVVGLGAAILFFLFGKKPTPSPAGNPNLSGTPGDACQGLDQGLDPQTCMLVQQQSTNGTDCAQLAALALQLQSFPIASAKIRQRIAAVCPAGGATWKEVPGDGSAQLTANGIYAVTFPIPIRLNAPVNALTPVFGSLPQPAPIGSVGTPTFGGILNAPPVNPPTPPPPPTTLIPVEVTNLLHTYGFEILVYLGANPWPPTMTINDTPMDGRWRAIVKSVGGAMPIPSARIRVWAAPSG